MKILKPNEFAELSVSEKEDYLAALKRQNERLKAKIHNAAKPSWDKIKVPPKPKWLKE
jgi:uncharacterized small protein (DUF1192 family)